MRGGRDPIRDHYSGGFQVALGAIDVLRRQLAVELGPHGIRVLTLQSGGVPETIREERREAIPQNVVNSSKRFPEASEAFGRELEGLWARVEDGRLRHGP